MLGVRGEFRGVVCLLKGVCLCYFLDGGLGSGADRGGGGFGGGSDGWYPTLRLLLLLSETGSGGGSGDGSGGSGGGSSGGPGPYRGSIGMRRNDGRHSESLRIQENHHPPSL